MRASTKLVPLFAALVAMALALSVERATYRPPEDKAAPIKCGVDLSDLAVAGPSSAETSEAFVRDFTARREYLSLLSLGLVAGLLAFAFQSTRRPAPGAAPLDPVALGPVEILRRAPECRLPLVAGLGAGLAAALAVPNEIVLALAAGYVLVGVEWLRRQKGASASPLAFAWATGSGIAVALSIRVATFMVDASRPELSALPFDAFYPTHSCLSAYVEAARRVLEVPNIYDRSLYEGQIGSLFFDPFLYPPPFLLAPRAALAISSDFFVVRAIWFFVETAIVIVALVALARWIGDRAGRVALLLAPLLFCAAPTLLTLQIGNFQLAAYALGVLAMIAFDRERPLVGGALLAFITLAKIYPGLLVVYLLARRRWSAVLATAGFAIAFSALALALFGRTPFEAFLHYQLPAIASGAAFPMLWQSTKAVAQNHSIYGLPLKLGALGLPHMNRAVASATSWVYLALVVVGTLALARRRAGSRREEAAVWIVLLFLGALRSPFAPDVYVQFAPLWLLTIVVARGGFRARQRALLVAGAIVLSVVTPYVAAISARQMIALEALPELAEIALVAFCLRGALGSAAVESAVEPAVAAAAYSEKRA